MALRLRRRVLGASLAIVLGSFAHSLLAQEAPEKGAQKVPVDIVWGVKIPMRDGVQLNATVYKPSEMNAPLPVIFTFTPYISDTYHERAWYFSHHGYVFALVDVRGRGNSGGDFAPFENEGRDGYDVVEWLAKQPWSNGKITMWGGSYAGFDQWSVLKEFPPHLATIVPAAAAHPGVDFPFFNNIFAPYDIQWLTFTSGKASNENLFAASDYWIAKFTKLYDEHLPFSDLDKIVGNPSATFQKWIKHPYPDSYLNAMVPTLEDYKKISIPILTITGDYDGDQPGALTYYRRHMKFGAPDVVARHYLIIGPWDHAGTRTPRADIGGLHFGPASMLDLNKLHTEWYDWTLKAGSKPEFLKQRVAYYVAGLEAWKYADSLDSVSNAKQTLYLSSDGSADDAFHSGVLADSVPTAASPDKFAYDPLDVRPAALEQADVPNFITDERFALNLFGEGVVYQSAPLEQDTEISGAPRLSVWLQMDVPDTDLQATLYVIEPDGRSIQLSGDAMRARYRDSVSQPQPVPAGEVVRYNFGSFTWFSREVTKGSRLRLVLKCINSISSEKNYNSGGVVETESGKDARTAHINVYHDAQHPSSLELPIVK